MTSSSGIQIHQALHGYIDGHREIALSAKLSSRDAKTLLTLSDRSGSGIAIPRGGYLTGYPLVESSMYVVARTWSAPELPRPGCVWTHSLLIDFTDLATLEDAFGLLRLFVRPSFGDAKGYKMPVRYVPREVTGALKFDLKARQILASLYGRPQDRVTATVPNEDPDSLILGIWEQQWPRLRRSFRFCSLSGDDRSVEGAPFDLQFLPADKHLRSRFPRAFEAERSTTSEMAWLEDALEDLYFPDKSGLRTFLRRMGGDVVKGRGSFAALCGLHGMLEHLDDDKMALNEAIALLEGTFGAGQARFARTVVTRTAASQVSRLDPEVFDFLLRNLELLGPEVPTSTLISIGEEVLRRAPEQLLAMLDDTGLMYQVARVAIEQLPYDDLFRGLEVIPALAGKILALRPEVVESAKFWSLKDLDVRFALTFIASDFALSESAAIALVSAVRADLASLTVEVLGAFRTGRTILALDHSLSIPKSWYLAIAEQPVEVAKLFLDRAVRFRQSLVEFARVMQPDSLSHGIGDDPWIVAIGASNGNLTERDNAYFGAFILARALGNRSRVSAELAVLSFELVYNSLVQKSMPDDGWDLLQAKLPWYRNDRDRCTQVCDAVGKLFAEQRCLPAEFHRLTANNNTFQKLASSMSGSIRGRAYLKTVRRSIKRSDGKQYKQRIQILDKVLQIYWYF